MIARRLVFLRLMVHPMPKRSGMKRLASSDSSSKSTQLPIAHHVHRHRRGSLRGARDGASSRPAQSSEIARTTTSTITAIIDSWLPVVMGDNAHERKRTIGLRNEEHRNLVVSRDAPGARARSYAQALCGSGEMRIDAFQTQDAPMRKRSSTSEPTNDQERKGSRKGSCPSNNTCPENTTCPWCKMLWHER